MIEFKFHGREKVDLIEKTVELIEKYQMKDKVVLITSSKDVLDKIAKKNFSNTKRILKTMIY